MKRVLLLLTTTTYRARDFLDAAERLGVEVVVGTDQRQTLEAETPGKALTLNFGDPGTATAAIATFSRLYPLDAILGADDETTLLAAMAAGALGLRANPVEAVRLTRNKHRMRETLARAGLPSPRAKLFTVSDDPKVAADEVFFPCVLKPTFLSASRGVIRADDPDAFEAAFNRIARILADPDVRRRGDEGAGEILVEEYIPGAEFAVEGILASGAFSLLALFDKPDPLEGPCFEETIYLTPSRAPADRQAAIVEAVRAGVRAIGLREGPVHAEVRQNDEGVFLLEIAARSIGGRCARALRFGAGVSLEELILRQGIGEEGALPARESAAAGIMMIPIQRAGVLKEVANLDEARAVAGIEDIDITIATGQPLVPLPEGHRYLGFIFARGERPETVEAALREAHRRIEVRVDSSRASGVRRHFPGW